MAMDKEETTAFGSIGIGLLGGLAMTFYPWAIPDNFRHVGFWVSVAGIIFGTLLLIDVHFLAPKRQVIRWGIPFAVGTLFFVLIFWIELLKPHMLATAPSAANPFDYKMIFSCDSVLPSAPWSGPGFVHVYELGSPPLYGVKAPDAGEDFLLPAGYSMAWNVKSNSLSVLKCTVSNYSDVTLLGVTTSLPTSYVPWKMNPNGLMGGVPVKGRYIITPPLVLTPNASPQSSQSFYISNPTKFVVMFSNPTEIQFSVAGTNEIQTAKLIPTDQPNPAIWPDVMPTNPVASLPPSPTPSSTPRKTTPQTPPAPISQ